MARQSLYQYKRDGIIAAIQSLTAAKGRAPALREIAEAADVSVATLHSYLQRMQDEGVVSWEAKHHRSLKVTGSPTGSGLGLNVTQKPAVGSGKPVSTVMGTAPSGTP